MMGGANVWQRRRLGGSARAWLFGALAIVNCYAALASAGWVEFMPTPYENGAYVDAFMSYERDHLKNGGLTNKWEDLFFREKLTFFSDGYSYHPRFLKYHFSIAGALREERYDSTGTGSQGWDESTGLEYDTTIYVLPEHPYNLEAYARRYEPLFKEQSATQHSNVENRQGFDFRYRDKPYFAHLGYLHDNVESSGYTSNINRMNLDGQYFNQFDSGNSLGFNGAFIPTWFDNTQGVNGSSTQYLLSNYLGLENVPSWAVPLRVTSSVTQNYFDQDSVTSGKLSNDQFVWNEWVTAFLPLNFRSNFYYRYQDNQSDSPGFDQSYISKNLRADLIHRLYESLDSTYSFSDNKQTSSGGESSFQGHSLTLNYAKNIPYGRLLLGTNLGTGETKNSGQIDVVNESFAGLVPMVQPYILGQANVDPNSIVLYLKSPLPPFDLIFLDPSYYAVVPIGNTYGIQVTNLPSQFVVPGTYDFLVSYSYSGDFRLRVDNLAANTSVELFDNMVTPYFSYLVISSDVLAGTFPGTPIDSTTYTSGLILRYAGLQVRGEYQKFEWEVAPYEAWRAEAQYVQPLDEVTSVFASGSYLNKNYPRGTSQYYTTAFTEETEVATTSLQRQFLERTLFASVGGAYAHTSGIVDSDSWTVNSSLGWRIGKVDLSVGANAYLSDASGTDTVTTRRDHQFVWVNMRRRIF